MNYHSQEPQALAPSDEP